MYRHFSKWFLLLFITSCSFASSNTPSSTNSLGIGTAPDISSLVPTSDYVFYSDQATVPSLFMALNITTHSKPSFLWFGRDTVDTTKLPSNITPIKGTLAEADSAMRSKIADINSANPNATFTLFLNDLRIAKASSFFYSQGISPDRVKVIQVNDGTHTYNDWVNQFGAANGSYEKWINAQNTYQSDRNQNVEPNYFLFTKPGVFLTVPSIANNTFMWLQWPELLSSDSQRLIDYLHQNDQNYLKVDANAYFNSLTAAQKAQFVDLVRLNATYTPTDGSGSTLNNQTIKEAFDNSPKPNIIITGTRPYGANTDSLIAQIKAFYGDGFDYFFKGHPGDTTKPSDTSVTVLPFRLPMEAIFFAYSTDISVIGGYQSSLYMSVPANSEKFFFNIKSDGSDLIPPLNLMFRDGLFGKVKVFN